MSAPASGHLPGKPAGPIELFTAFAGISMMGFGGVLPWVRWMLVEKKRWMNDEELVNALSLCQLIPGGNVMNIAVYVGARFAGFMGAAAALSGLVLIPSLIVLALGVLYDTYGHLAAVQGMFRGMSAAAAGLILAMGARLAWRFRTDWRALPVLAATIFAMAVIKLPLLVILATLLPLSLAVSYFGGAK